MTATTTTIFDLLPPIFRECVGTYSHGKYDVRFPFVIDGGENVTVNRGRS